MHYDLVLMDAIWLVRLFFSIECEVLGFILCSDIVFDRWSCNNAGQRCDLGQGRLN